MTTIPDFDYDVALSFAGEDRAYVARVAALLQAAQVKVFYDTYEKVTLWGKDLYAHLSDVYQHRARYTVLFASKHYADKVWTNHERRSAQARAIEERREYILPARFDDSEIPGLLPTTGYVDLRNESPQQLAELVLAKLGRAIPTWEITPQTELPGESVPPGQSLRSLALQLSTAAAAREQRRRFLASRDGATAAQREVDELFTLLATEVGALKEIDTRLDVTFHIDHRRVAVVRSPRASFTMHWGGPSASLQGSSLFTQEFDRSYSLDGRPQRDPEQKAHWHFALDDAGGLRWRSANDTGIMLTSKQLADRYLSRVVRRMYANDGDGLEDDEFDLDE